MGYLHSRMDTLAAMQERQFALEQNLKEDARTVAARGVQRFARRQEWPEEDLNEVLGALGLVG